MIQIQPLKGFRDFLPKEALTRQAVISNIKTVFEQYGFDPLETPALEYADTLMGKYGDEGDKLLYLFTDNGGRKVGMRYDQTVPLSRVIAQYADLPLPFKRYQIQPVWRAENTQKGRYREFLQCDIDTVGSSSPIADAEIIACVLTIAKALGLPSPVMSINDRTIFDTLDLSKKEIIIIDKLDKIGKEKVVKELEQLEAKSKFEELEIVDKTERINQIFTYLTNAGFEEDKDFKFDPFLARGLDYYTSTIFELKDTAYPAGSLAGGGRYDKLIGMFSGRELPAVGVAFGFDRLVDALTELKLLEIKQTVSRVLVTVFSPDLLEQSVNIVNELRNNGISTELYLDPDSKLEKQLKYADKKGIPFVVIIGPEEAQKSVINVKHMQTREEQKDITVEQLLLILQGS